jgi:isoleucyl-tRNA synthetase
LVPRLSQQWFLRVGPLAETARCALADPALRFNDERWRKRCQEWFEAAIADQQRNHQGRWWEGACLALVQGHDSNPDWIISRQNPWGQRIPYWLCRSCTRPTISTGAPRHCQHCGGAELEAGTDVFDVWFGSALFAAEVSPKLTGPLADVSALGHDMLEFWIPAATMLTLHLYGRLPFGQVVVHGLVGDAMGRKMSKSLGNSVSLQQTLAAVGVETVRAAVLILVERSDFDQVLTLTDAVLAESAASAAKIASVLNSVIPGELDHDRLASAESDIAEALSGGDISTAYRMLRQFVEDLSTNPRLGPGQVERLLGLVECFHPLIASAVAERLKPANSGNLATLTPPPHRSPVKSRRTT